MPACRCHRCGEIITAPYWFQGNPYGYSCIRYVNPTAKKNKSTEHWVIADCHNIDISRNEKQPFVANYEGKKYKDFVFRNHNALFPQTLNDKVWRLQADGTLYINIVAFKGYEKSKS